EPALDRHHRESVVGRTVIRNGGVAVHLDHQLFVALRPLCVESLEFLARYGDRQSAIVAFGPLPWDPEGADQRACPQALAGQERESFVLEEAELLERGLHTPKQDATDRERLHAQQARWSTHAKTSSRKQARACV